MGVQVENLEVPQGATYNHTFHYRDSAGAIIDLTGGYTARMQIRASYSSSVKLYDSETTSDITITGASGDLAIKIASLITAAFSFKKAVYDIELINPSGEVTRFVQGKITVTPEVTK